MIPEGISKISWYPGHMHRGMKLIKEHISSIDVFLEVRDARVPLSSFNPQIDEIIKEHRKEKIVLFNKFDLCDESKTNKVYPLIQGYQYFK
jgi:ribosome biogenesis GTPase A